jgi:succinate dehydrogenase hydrophobic anchor subunit
MRSFARSGIRLVIPMVASAVVVVLLWIAFLKVFAINPVTPPPG